MKTSYSFPHSSFVYAMIKLLNYNNKSTWRKQIKELTQLDRSWKFGFIIGKIGVIRFHWGYNEYNLKYDGHEIVFKL